MRQINRERGCSYAYALGFFVLDSSKLNGKKSEKKVIFPGYPPDFIEF